MRILAVDDTKENLYLLESILKGGGHEVVTAGNGEEALVVLEQGKVDLIISDILMPKMDGFQLCLKCKSDPRFNALPFILCTSSYTEAKDESFAASLGADKFLVRPTEPAELLRLINEVAKTKVRAVAKGLSENDAEYLKSYNERLLRKLEQKMTEQEADIKRRQQLEVDIKKRLEELEIFYKSAMDREDKIMELKKKVEELEKRG